MILLWCLGVVSLVSGYETPDQVVAALQTRQAALLSLAPLDWAELHWREAATAANLSPACSAALAGLETDLLHGKTSAITMLDSDGKAGRTHLSTEYLVSLIRTRSMLVVMVVGVLCGRMWSGVQPGPGFLQGNTLWLGRYSECRTAAANSNGTTFYLVSLALQLNSTAVPVHSVAAKYKESLMHRT